MTEVAWDYDSPIKSYDVGQLNCRLTQRGGDVVLEPIPGWWWLGLTLSTLIASLGFLAFAYFAKEAFWQMVIVGLAIAFPIVGFVSGRLIDSVERRRGEHLVFSADGRILLPRHHVEIRPDENTEFCCHRYWNLGDHVEDLVLHHGDTTYWVFSSGVPVPGTSGTEKLRRELQEHLQRSLALQSRE